MTEQQSELDQHRVRVWFGEPMVTDYVALPETAACYEAAMRRRFAGLTVTNEPLGEASPTKPPQSLPKRRLWELTP